MNRTTFRTLLFGVLLAPLAVLGVGVHASASTLASTAHFTGGFTTSCDLVNTDEPPNYGGTYTCTHTATSTVCATVVVEGDLAVSKGGLCHADLSGSTQGAWSAPSAKAVYRCDNGSGSGTLTYQPTPFGRSFYIPVALNVIPNTQVIEFNGSLFDSGSGQTLIARGTLKSVCSAGTSSPVGYDGDITPV